METKCRGTILPAVSRRLLSVPAHSAEMERFRSSMGLTNTPIRIRFRTYRLFTVTQVAVHMCADAEAARSPRVTCEPRILVGEALAAGVSSGWGGGGGVQLRTINEGDEDQLEEDAVDADEGMQKAAGEFHGALDEEHLSMGGKEAAPIVLENGVTAGVEGSEVDGAAAAELVRAEADFIRIDGAAAPTTAVTVANGSERPRWTVDSTSQLRPV